MRFETLTLKASPNQYLVAPVGLCQNAKPHLESPIYAMTAEALEDLLSEKLLTLPRTKEAMRSAEDGQRALCAAQCAYRISRHADFPNLRSE